MTGSNSFWLANPSTGFYNGDVQQSLRLFGTTGYLDHQFGTPTSQKKMIFAVWVKPGEFGDKQHIMGSGPNVTNYFLFCFSAAGFYNSVDSFKFGVVSSNTQRIYRVTDRLFRDPNAWMHVCVAIDTTQATSSNRIQLFFNGKRYTGGFSLSTTPSQDYDIPIVNTAIYHQIGLLYTGANYGYYDGHLADFYFLDGQSIYSDTSATINSTFLADADTLGTFCEQKNGVAIPKAYTGATSTYGNNGFRLEFKNNTAGGSSPSSSTLGADTSGKDNHFNDYSGLGTFTGNVLDCPENNFATMSPINSDSNANIEGGFRCTMGGGGNYDQVRSDFGLSSGKWYWEVYIEERGYIPAIGVMAGYTGPSTNPTHWVTFGFGQWHITYNGGTPTYQVNQNSGGGTNWGVTMPSNGNIIMVAIDVDNNKIWWGRNGTWYNSSGTANPATGTDSRVTLTSGQTWHPMLTLDTGASSLGASNAKMRMNFGQDASFGNSLTGGDVGTETDGNGNGLFKYAPPTDYLACCTANLPDTTLSPNQAEQADDFFDIISYTGDGTSSRNIDGLNFQPDWVWFAQRNNTSAKLMFDSSRGVNKALYTTSSGAETDSDQYGYLSAFRSQGGFTATAGSTNNNYINENNVNIVAWSWKINGGTTSSDTNGNRTSTVQVNTKAGISIATYNNPSQGNHTFGHGLGSKPEAFIWRARNTAMNWIWWNSLNFTDADKDGQYFNSNIGFTTGSNWVTDVTDTTINITDGQVSSGNNINYWCISFKSVEGFSKINNYIGNGDADGPFVYTGFRPAWVLIKGIGTTTNGWYVYDYKRETFGTLIDANIYINLTTGEDNGNRDVDFLSNGFKPRLTDTNVNGSGTTYVYMAFAEQPFKFTTAR